MAESELNSGELEALADDVRHWSAELGFSATRITATDLGDHPERMRQWLARGFHADMDYLVRNMELRAEPNALVPGTARIISVRLNYRPKDTAEPADVLASPDKAYIARYALGRDYHKVMRRRLARLAQRIELRAQQAGHRAFVDSAPVLEKGIGQRAGHGWIGKNTLLLTRDAGSWFFLGELFTTLPLPIDPPQESEHCGSCQACIDICPTGAIVGPQQLDARRCIAWLTIENKGIIPEPLRRPMGNRVFGCDDCQIVCPWNRDAPTTREADFGVRHNLDGADLLELFSWDEATFQQRTEGMALRRINYEQWQRNLAVGLGNAPRSAAAADALSARLQDSTPLVREHVQWALNQQSGDAG